MVNGALGTIELAAVRAYVQCRVTSVDTRARIAEAAPWQYFASSTGGPSSPESRSVGKHHHAWH